MKEKLNQNFNSSTADPVVFSLRKEFNLGFNSDLDFVYFFKLLNSVTCFRSVLSVGALLYRCTNIKVIDL